MSQPPLTVHHDIAFAFDTLPDRQTLAARAAAAAAGAEGVVLDGTTDGLRQTAAQLAGREALHAVQPFSHGSAGQLQTVAEVCP